jgi:hypothetical protein
MNADLYIALKAFANNQAVIQEFRDAGFLPNGGNLGYESIIRMYFANRRPVR